MTHDTTGMDDTIADGEFFSGLAKPVSFFILRHGQSEGNSKKIYQGKLEFSLDAVGLGQAAAAGRWLAAKTPDAIVTSGQKRALETARSIAAQCALPDPLVWDELSELDVGIFSGLGWDEAAHRYPDIFREFRATSWDAVLGAESSDALYARAIHAWRRLRELALQGKENIICVSHGGFIQWLFRATFGYRSWLPLVPLSNCGIFEFRVEPLSPDPRAFTQWSLLNFRAPDSGPEVKPVF